MEALVFSDEAAFRATNILSESGRDPSGLRLRDSPAVRVFCAITCRKVCGPFFIPGAHTLQTWLLPQPDRKSQDSPSNRTGSPQYHKSEASGDRWIGGAGGDDSDVFLGFHVPSPYTLSACRPVSHEWDGFRMRISAVEDLRTFAEKLRKDEEDQAQLSGDTVDSAMREANDVSISHPYYDIARHGIIHVAGDDNSGRKVITFSCCRLPPCHEIDHVRLLEYVKHTLDQYVENDYTVVYFHYGLNSRNKPSLSWLQSAYKAFDRKYKKNLKALYVVHPTNFIKVLWKIFKPVISHKFGKKVLYMNHLSDLRDHLRFNRLIIPQDVLQHDEKLRVQQKRRPPPIGKAPPPRPPLPTQQFGVSLQYLKNKNKGALIPPVMEQTISCLKAKGLRTEGLFRRSVSSHIIKDIQKRYNLGKAVDFAEYGDEHVPASTLKTFLRELPEPLLTFASYRTILEITSVESILRVNSCKQIAHRLPEHNYAVLKYLMCFLNMVSMENISNKMTASNLACVFGVNLVWPQEGAPSINALVPVNLFTELMIEFYPKIFNSRTIPGETLP